MQHPVKCIDWAPSPCMEHQVIYHASFGRGRVYVCMYVWSTKSFALPPLAEDVSSKIREKNEEELAAHIGKETTLCSTENDRRIASRAQGVSAPQ
jgi:hypothetical protein